MDWERKTTTIEEAIDLKTLTLDELIGNLMAYEVHIEERRIEENETLPKKKSLAFKATSYDEEEDDDDSDEELDTFF